MKFGRQKNTSKYIARQCTLHLQGESTEGEIRIALYFFTPSYEKVCNIVWSRCIAQFNFTKLHDCVFGSRELVLSVGGNHLGCESQGASPPWLTPWLQSKKARHGKLCIALPSPPQVRITLTWRYTVYSRNGGPQVYSPRGVYYVSRAWLPTL